MNRALTQIAASLAFIIGAMAIVAGGQVLLGKVPDYYVVSWLPAYNFTMGLLTDFLTARLIWKNSQWARPAAIGTFSAHAIVMLILLVTYREVVAPDSIVAMSIRLAVWLIILVLMVVPSPKNRVAT